MVKLNNSDYIKTCKVTHGDAYDYSLTEYTGAGKNVIIICP
jgi:hypothetical protein